MIRRCMIEHVKNENWTAGKVHQSDTRAKIFDVAFWRISAEIPAIVLERFKTPMHAHRLSILSQSWTR